MEPQNQNPQPNIQQNNQITPNPVPVPAPSAKAGLTSAKVIGLIFGGLLALGILSWVVFHSRINNTPSTLNSQTKPMAQNALKFPSAQYKDFAVAANSDSLDPKKAYPNITEYGTLHLVITQNAEGYSIVNLPLHGITLNIPFGWASRGGFDTMERVDFYPANSITNPTQTPPIDLGIKVLDSSGLDATDFDGVMAKVIEITTEGQTATTEVDEIHHAFLVKTETINNPNLTVPSSNYSIYIQSPSANSTAWVDVDIRAPKAEFEKYAGLLGLLYRDIKIDWSGLDSYMAQKSGQTNAQEQNDPESVESYVKMQEESREYEEFAKQVISNVAKGNTDFLKNNFSPSVVAANPPGALDSTMLPATKKFFANFDHIGNSVDIHPSDNSFGNGYSFAMTAVYKDGSEKPFKIYIVKENGELVVGNLVATE